MKKSNQLESHNIGHSSHSSSPKSSCESNGGSTSSTARPLFKGEFKNYKVDKPKRMSKSISSSRKERKTIMIDQQKEQNLFNPPKPIPISKKESMSQLTFHESYSKDLCPFGKVKVKNNPVRNHPYVQQFVLNTCQSSATNNVSPKITSKFGSNMDLIPCPKTIQQKDNQNFQIFHFKVGQQGGSMEPPHQSSSVLGNLLLSTQSQTSFHSSFNSSSSCSSTNTSNSDSSTGKQDGGYNSNAGGAPNPIKMESINSEPELIILPPFRQVEKSENIKIPSIQYIESLLHSAQNIPNTQIYS